MKPVQTAAFGVSEYEVGPKATYRPRLSPEHRRRLRLMKAATGKPINQHVSEALDFYFELREGG